MADDNKNDALNQDAKKAEAGMPVCTMNVAKILTALHQNALANTNAASKGYVIANSAISEDGKTVESAGEHVISLIREDPSKGDSVKKTDAVSMLKTYVQWFVGPDLAKKVNDSTVLPLNSAPSEVKKDEGKDEKELSESKFMPFGKWLSLHEASDDVDNASDEDDEDEAYEEDDEDTSDEEDSSDEGDDASGEDGDEGEDVDDEDGEGGENQKLDPKVESKEGYYITYSLKVEGLPQKALKDAMKKFAATFFDDVKIYGSGLFGGSYSFTVKDVKDKLKDTFGRIDPDELVSNIKQKISKKMPETDATEVNIRDKDTLIADLGSEADAQQKKKINSANYSVWIKVQKDDPKKAFFNPREIADIVTSSIKGLFKKFKNAITKNDVIYIPNYTDMHADTRNLRKLFKSIPTFKQMEEMVKGSKPYTKIENVMDKLAKDDQFDNCKRARAVVAKWKAFSDEASNSKSEIDNYQDEKDRVNKFSQFLKDYKKIIDDTKNEESELSESYMLAKYANFIEQIQTLNDKDFIAESLLGSLFEDDDADEAIEDDEEENGGSNGSDGDSAKQLTKDMREKVAKKFMLKLKQQFGIASSISLNPTTIDIANPTNLVSIAGYDGIIKLVDEVTGAKNEINNMVDNAKNDQFVTVMTVNSGESKDNTKKNESVQKSLMDMLFETYKMEDQIRSIVSSGLAEDILLEKNGVDRYIEDNKLSKEDALKPEHIKAMAKRKDVKKSEDWVRAKVERHFSNASNDGQNDASSDTSSTVSSDRDTQLSNGTQLSGDNEQTNSQPSSNTSDNNSQNGLPIQYSQFESFVKSLDFYSEFELSSSLKPIVDLSEQLHSTGVQNATLFTVPFSIENQKEGVESAKPLGGDVDNSSSKTTGTFDLYLIPMPGLKYKDDDF